LRAVFARLRLFRGKDLRANPCEHFKYEMMGRPRPPKAGGIGKHKISFFDFKLLTMVDIFQSEAIFFPCTRFSKPPALTPGCVIYEIDTQQRVFRHALIGWLSAIRET
jgi:hypothetical protein